MSSNIFEFFENLAHFTHGMAFMFFVFVGFELYLTKNKNSLLKFFFWVTVFWVFIELKDIVYLVDGLWNNDTLGALNLCIDTWCVPVTILFMFEVLSPRWVNLRRAFIVFLPFLVLTALYIITANMIFFKILFVISVISGIIAVAIVFRASKKYDKYLKENYSNLEHLTVRWLRTYIVMLFLCLVIWGITNWCSTWLSDIFFYLFLTTIWIIFYFYSKRHILVEVPDILNFRPIVSDKETVKQHNENNQNLNFSFAEKLAELMETKHLYLNPSLTIMELASAVGTNRTYLSDYLHRQLNTNFYDYVNSFRIKKACSMFYDIENIATVAETCGFNSISTFRRAFIKQTGKTPSEYKEDL